MDSIARDGVQFTQFQVCPCCSPTRSSLLTGRYNYRTGIVDTFMGRSMMYWGGSDAGRGAVGRGLQDGHLRQMAPGRQLSDARHGSGFPGNAGAQRRWDRAAFRSSGSSYFDPILFHNGEQVQRRGYCTDVFFNAAMEWMEANRDRPFFAYIPTNAPHGPLQIDEKYVEPFRGKGLDDEDREGLRHGGEHR